VLEEDRHEIQLRLVPALSARTLYALCNDSFLTAIDLRDHRVVWRKRVGPSVAGANSLPENNSSPAIANHVVYAGVYLGSLYALNAGTGALLRQFQTRLSVESSPAVVNGAVYVGSQDGSLYAFGLNAHKPPGPKQGCTGVKTVTCTVLATGEHTFVVPNGVMRLRVAAVGGEGAPQVGVYGGAGARVSATVRVTQARPSTWRSAAMEACPRRRARAADGMAGRRESTWRTSMPFMDPHRKEEVEALPAFRRALPRRHHAVIAANLPRIRAFWSPQVVAEAGDWRSDAPRGAARVVREMGRQHREALEARAFERSTKQCEQPLAVDHGKRF
jgi:hypothetical protein